MANQQSRREFIRSLGLSTAALPFVLNLPSLSFANSTSRKQRLIFMFSPNGVVPWEFWPDAEGADLTLKKILSPLEPWKDRLLTLNGISNKVRGDGDSHMRGMSCLLTGIELFPGNIQGGSHTPAGWASGISIDQEIKDHLQNRPESRTRFGSLQCGVAVPDRADPWTRMVYAGANKPLVPMDDPYQLFAKLYGQLQDRENLASILDDLQEDLKKVRAAVGTEDKRLLEEHETFVREMERQIQADADADEGASSDHEPPELEPGVDNVNDNIPKLSRMQIDLIVNGFTADFARIASLQYSNSVGQIKMRWLGIEEGHHELSHHPDSQTESQEKLIEINHWFCGELAYLVERLAATPEPGGEGTLLDNTTVVWTNELGKGNSHTLNDVPFVLVGGGCDFRMGRALKYDKVAHNRLHLALAHQMGHPLEAFGKPELCEAGPLEDLV